jgi:hypothetical protein
VEESADAGVFRGRDDFLCEANMHRPKCASAALVEDSNEVDDGVGAVEQSVQGVRIINVRAEKPDRVENPQGVRADR